MAFQIAGALLGSSMGILGALGQNRAVKKARDRAIAQENVRTAIEIGNNARRTSQITGARKVSLADRNVFGRSSQAALLSDLSTGLRNEEALMLQEFFNVADIKAQASRQRQSVFSSAVSGALSGFQFGSQLDGLAQASAVGRVQDSFNNGTLMPILTRGIGFRFGP